MAVVLRVLPAWLRGYRRTWLSVDVVAGLTLAAVAIPECMGYTSIARMPIVTGLYTVIFPTIVFVLLGSSKLLVVGADSATAAILAAGPYPGGEPDDGTHRPGGRRVRHRRVGRHAESGPRRDRVPHRRGADRHRRDAAAVEAPA
jgi:hypothetical protein